MAHRFIDGSPIKNGDFPLKMAVFNGDSWWLMMVNDGD